MRGSRFALLACLTAVPLSVLAVACSLDESGFGLSSGDDGGPPPFDGTVPDTNPPDSNSPSDAGTDSPVQQVCVTGDAHACDSVNIPQGWHPVRYLSDAGSCDPGFDSQDVVTNPDGGSCSCDPQCAPDPSQCGTPDFNSKWDQGAGQCTNGTTPIGMKDQRCHAFYDGTGSINTGHFLLQPQQGGGWPDNESCSYPVTNGDAAVTSQPARLCTSQNAACNGLLCADKHVCIAQDDAGSASCPDHFHRTPVQVGSGASVQCSGTCSCNGDCVGTAYVYLDTACGDAGGADASPGSQVPLDSACHQVGDGSHQDYRSILYVPTIPVTNCSNPPPAKPQLDNARWVCCHD